MHPQISISVEILPAACTTVRRWRLKKLASCNKRVILKVSYGHGKRRCSTGRYRFLSASSKHVAILHHFRDTTFPADMAFRFSWSRQLLLLGNNVGLYAYSSTTRSHKHPLSGCCFVILCFATSSKLIAKKPLNGINVKKYCKVYQILQRLKCHRGKQQKSFWVWILMTSVYRSPYMTSFDDHSKNMVFSIFF